MTREPASLFYRLIKHGQQMGIKGYRRRYAREQPTCPIEVQTMQGITSNKSDLCDQTGKKAWFSISCPSDRLRVSDCYKGPGGTLKHLLSKSSKLGLIGFGKWAGLTGPPKRWLLSHGGGSGLFADGEIWLNLFPESAYAKVG
jgi:hypothetical protein